MSDGASSCAERALGLVSGDEAEVVVTAEHSGFARYAGKEVHQPTLIDNASVQLRLDPGRASRRRHARTGPTTRASPSSFAGRPTSSRARAPTRSSRRSPRPPSSRRARATTRRPPPSAPTTRPGSRRLRSPRPATSACTGTSRAASVELAIASTTGLRASQRTTDANWLALAAVDGASGYATRTSWRVGDVDPAEAAEEAVAKAARTRNAEEAPPAKYRAVLEPYAIAELLYYCAFDMFNGLALLEERSYFAGRIGEQRVRPEGHARRRRARPRQPPDGSSTSRARRSSGSRWSRRA